VVRAASDFADLALLDLLELGLDGRDAGAQLTAVEIDLLLAGTATDTDAAALASLENALRRILADVHAGVEEEEDDHAFEEAIHKGFERLSVGRPGDPSDEQAAEEEEDGGVEEGFAQERGGRDFRGGEHAARGEHAHEENAGDDGR
jgi:hypothetical protein